MIVAKHGMNFRTKSVVPSTERSSLMVVGAFKSTMMAALLIQSTPMRIPLADKICPR